MQKLISEVVSENYSSSRSLYEGTRRLHMMAHYDDRWCHEIPTYSDPEAIWENCNVDSLDWCHVLLLLKHLVHPCAYLFWHTIRASDPASTFNVLPEVLPATHLNDFCSLVKDTKFSLELLAVERFCFEVPLSSVNPPCTSITGKNNVVQRMPTKRPHVLQAALERIAAFQQSTLTFILVALSLKVLADCWFEGLRRHDWICCPLPCVPRNCVLRRLLVRSLPCNSLSTSHSMVHPVCDMRCQSYKCGLV